MERAMRIFGAVLLVCATGIAIWAIIRGIQQEPAIVGSLMTALSGLGILALQQRGQRKDAIRQARREQLAPLYEKLTNLVRTIAKVDSEAGQRRAEQVLSEFQDKLLIWGPPSLVRAWANAMRTFERDPSSSEAVMAYAEILLEIRSELGQDDQELDPRDLLRLFITDIDEVLPPAQG
jgi:hypothetical protein